MSSKRKRMISAWVLATLKKQLSMRKDFKNTINSLMSRRKKFSRNMESPKKTKQK